MYTDVWVVKVLTLLLQMCIDVWVVKVLTLLIQMCTDVWVVKVLPLPVLTLLMSGIANATTYVPGYKMLQYFQQSSFQQEKQTSYYDDPLNQ